MSKLPLVFAVLIVVVFVANLGTITYWADELHKFDADLRMGRLKGTRSHEFVQNTYKTISSDSFIFGALMVGTIFFPIALFYCIWSNRRIL
mmetsp:Transcript_51670/g.105184  ORF Transcript_51670/g.105184 Transcript_51670/m.105184 type:complete len:91 (+) Transcript_51670:163-435(+)